jgi:HD superfamily phosphohydrolase
LYGFIDLSELETKLIDTAIFQRLRFIKQLSHAYLVYPTAIHTRFEHSLGATHLADKMSMELGLEPQKRDTIRIAALLHDVGHGPFSHLFEHIIKKINPQHEEPHEIISKIIINEDHEIDSIIKDQKKSVIELLGDKSTVKHNHELSLMSDIVSSGLDADKLDYLRRDSYHIGVAYGQFDLDRILHTIRSTPPKHTKICIDIKGKDALENYRLGRYLMHAQVYEHHTRLAADQMFLKALDIAIHEEGVIDPKLLKINPTGDNKEFLNFYLGLDDNSIYEMILASPKSKLAKEILLNIKKRKLLKRACDFTPKKLENHAEAGGELMKMKAEDFEKIGNDVAESIGLQKHEVIFHRSKIDIKLYKEGEILFLDKENVLDLTGSSPITAKDSVIRYYVYGPHDVTTRKKIACAVAEKLDVPTEKISYVGV